MKIFVVDLCLTLFISVNCVNESNYDGRMLYLFLQHDLIWTGSKGVSWRTLRQIALLSLHSYFTTNMEIHANTGTLRII